MKGIFALLVAVLYAGVCAAQPNAAPRSAQPVTIKDIKLVEDHFSHKRLSATVVYDGSLGDSMMMGPIVMTKDLVNGVGYSPVDFSTGVSQIIFGVGRPHLMDKKSTTSYAINFDIYRMGDRGALRLEIPFSIQWKSLEDHYGLKPVKATHNYSSITKVDVDESLKDAPAIVQALATSGMELDKITVHDRSSLSSMKGVALRFSEGANAQDFKRILEVVKKAGSSVSSVGFDQANDEDFELGRTVISNGIRGKQIALDDAMRLQIENAKDMTGVYGILGLKLESPDVFLAKAVDQARLLNMNCGRRTTCKQAYDLAHSVLQQDPDNTMASIQAAFAALQIYDIGGAITESMGLVDKALKKHPGDGDLLSWKGFLLYLDDSRQEAESYFIKAKDRPKQMPAFYLREHAKNLVALHKIGDADKLYKELMTGKYSHPDDIRGQYEGLEEYLDLLKEADSPDVEVVYEKLLSDFPDNNSACEKPAYARYLLTKHADTRKVRNVMSDPGISCEHAAPIRRLLLIADWSESKAHDKAAITRLLKDLGDVATGIAEIASLAMGENVIRQMAEAGVDLNQSGPNGMSALHLAAAEDDAKAVELLLKNKARVDVASTIEGATPLIIAVAQQEPAMVQLLLRYKANPALKAKDGRSALDIANLIGDKKLIALLKANQSAI